MISKLIHTCDN